jgi:signal transduction histidine kinase
MKCRLRHLRKTFLACIVFTVGLASFPLLAAEQNDGYLDLRNWNAETAMVLSGRWEVIRGRIVRPADYNAAYRGATTTLPDVWGVDNNKIAIENDWPEGFGSASYRLKLVLPKTGPELSLTVLFPYSAHEIWINGVLVSTNGKVSETPEQSEAFYLNRSLRLPSVPNIEIVLIVSNYEHEIGGIARPPILDLSSRTEETNRMYEILYFTAFGALCVLFFSRLAFYFSSHADSQKTIQIWYCLSFGIIIARLVLANMMQFKLFPDLTQYGQKTIDYFIVYVSPAIYVTFLATVYPIEFPKKPRLIIYAITAPFLATVIFLPVHIFSLFHNYFQIFALGFVIYYQYGIIKVWQNKQKGAGAILFFTIIFSITCINDALHYLDALTWKPSTIPDLMPFGFLALSIGHEISLNVRSHFIYDRARALTQKLQTLNATLDQKVKSRTKEMTEAKLSAEKSAREKTDFLSSASHDLRQPVHALSIFNATLISKSKEDHALSTLVENQSLLIHSLSEMLDTMLEASQLEAKTLTTHDTDVSLFKLLNEVQKGLQPIADQNGVELRIVLSSLHVRADERHLRRIISNLAINAINAAGGGRVLIGVRRRTHALDIEVIDNGNGIPPEKVDRIFDRFYRGDNTPKTSKSGLGLGLSIVSELCALMGWTVSVKSLVGHGTKFAITPDRLKNLQVRPENLAMQPLNNPTDRPKLLLVVDDNQQALEAMVQMFRQWGHAACGVQSLEAAVDTLTDLGRPDAIITDYRLSADTTGLDVIKSVRKRYLDTPAVIVTGATSPTELRILANSDLPVLHKPVDSIQIRKLLNL